MQPQAIGAGALEAAGDDGVKAAETMLTAQAHALQTMFVYLARRAVCQEQVGNIEVFARLALKAQGQCRATLETLSLIKNPPGAIVRQTNIGNAVQVNNGADVKRPGRLGGRHVEQMDARETGAAGEAHPALAPVGALNRTKD